MKFLRQQQHQIFTGDVPDQVVVGANDRVCQVALCLLEGEDLFFDCVASNQSISKDAFRLADAVRAIDGLRFDRRVPPGIEQEDILGSGQIQTLTTSFQADQKQLALRIGLKVLDSRAAIASLAIKIFINYSFAIEPLLHNRQKTGELGKDQHLVSFLDHFAQPRNQDVEFGARFPFAAL